MTYFSESHEYVRVEGEFGYVGISDYAQKQLGNIVYVDMPDVDDDVEVGEVFGAVESVKAASDLLSPVSGTVVEVNESLEDSPELINQDANEAVARLAKEHGVRVILNTAPCQPLSDEFLSGVYLVTPNEVEAEALTGIAVKDQQSADRAAQVLFAKGVQNVLITLGSRGVYLNTAGRSEIIPAYRVKAVDTTGAGDAFNGGLLTALSEGKSLREAARFGNALAALSVQRMGAAPSMPTRAEIEAFLAAHGA